MFSLSSEKTVIRLFIFCLIFVCSQIVFAGGDEKWREITPAELQMKTPQVEADADAEAIFWEVSVADAWYPRAGFRTVLNHYLRMKIFTDRGRETNSKIDIPFGKIPDLGVNVAIMDIAARTVKPDGSIVELKPEDIFERDVVKASGVKLQAKSFAVPGIETGAIIEYRWKEVRYDAISFYVRLSFAREIPVQFLKYSLKPYKAGDFPYGMRIHSFNVQNRFAPGEAGFYTTTMTNVKAFQEEPKMPSEYVVKPWILVYYAADDDLPVEKYWKSRAENIYENHKSLLKPTGEIRQAAAQAVGDASEAEEKIRRVFEFCRANIKNIDDDASGLTTEQRETIKENKSTSDTLKKRSGTWHDINMLFGAMLASAGFEVRVAGATLSSDAVFDRNLTNDYFLRTENIAVKVGDKWKFYDPGLIHVPFGMLYWAEEGQTALISDPKEAIWATTPVSAPESSKEKRSARLQLNEDGSMEGDVRIEYTGHLAERHKEFNDDDSPAEREKTLVEMIRKNILPMAEIKDVSIENIQTPDKPFVYAFKIRLPRYGELTGKRIFLRPNIFERGTSALFTAGTRKYDISFEYPWTEEDDVTIELPAGYAVESAEAPASIVEQKSGSRHKTKISLSDDKKTLIYRREFLFGGSGNLFFPKSSYSGLKQVFESFHSAEAHIVALRHE